MLLRRPFFLLVSVKSPVSLRWKRYKGRSVSLLSHMNRKTYAYASCENAQTEAPSLEQFVIQIDDHLYNRESGMVNLIDQAELRIVNSGSSLGDLYETLKDLNLADMQRLRPSWDQYFMQLASLAAQRSNCMKRRVGCVLVQGKRVISTGYNGTPRNLRNCNEGGCEHYMSD